MVHLAFAVVVVVVAAAAVAVAAVVGIAGMAQEVDHGFAGCPG